MIVLTIRTDKPIAEIGLFEDGKELAYTKWQAHRELSRTIHDQIAKNLQFVGKNWGAIGGIVCFRGPGSFTGLRIGLSVANALAQSLESPIVGEGGEDWRQKGIERLQNGEDKGVATAEYGSDPYVTAPKK